MTQSMTNGNNPAITSLFKLAQIIMPVVIALLIPWGSWVTYRVICFEEWKTSAAHFLTTKDAEALELRVRSAAVDLYDRKFSTVETKIDGLQAGITELKIMLREHEAKTPRP